MNWVLENTIKLERNKEAANDLLAADHQFVNYQRKNISSLPCAPIWTPRNLERGTQENRVLFPKKNRALFSEKKIWHLPIQVQLSSWATWYLRRPVASLPKSDRPLVQKKKGDRPSRRPVHRITPVTVNNERTWSLEALCPPPAQPRHPHPPSPPCSETRRPPATPATVV